MPTEELNVGSHFQRYVERRGAKGTTGEVASALAQRQLGSGVIPGILRTYGDAHEIWFRKQLLDLVLDFIEAAVTDGAISEKITQDIRSLKEDLGIREGEFFKYRPAEVAAILGQQLDYILEDLQIDTAEDLYQVELQDVFDLSYDQYLQLTRSAFERALETLREAIHRAEWSRDNDALSRLQQQRSALEPVAQLALAQKRTLGSLY